MRGGEYPPAPQINGCPGTAIADIGPARIIRLRFQIERIILALDDEADGPIRRKNEYGEGERDQAAKSEFGVCRDVRTPFALSWRHLGSAYDPAPMESASADHSSGVTRPK